MTELSIKVRIGDRDYPMKVRQDQERQLRQAGKLLNEKIRSLRSSFAVEDNIDLISMVAFDTMVQMLKSEKELNELKETTQSKLKQYEAVIDSVLTEKK